jgi:hypothetical protein
MRDGIKSEQRSEAEQGSAGLGTSGKKAENQKKAENAADITGRPTGTGQSPDLLGWDQCRHHRIIEHDRELSADDCDRIGQKQRRDHANIARTSEPHQRGANDQKPAKGRDPRLALAAGIRDGPKHWR